MQTYLQLILSKDGIVQTFINADVSYLTLKLDLR